MDSMDYANKLVKEFDLNQTDAIRMIDIEVEYMRNDNMRSRKIRYSQALEESYEHIREWLTRGDEYVVKLEWADLAKFAGSHRRACVWAVLTCKARKAVQRG